MVRSMKEQTSNKTIVSIRCLNSVNFHQRRSLTPRVPAAEVAVVHLASRRWDQGLPHLIRCSNAGSSSSRFQCVGFSLSLVLSGTEAAGAASSNPSYHRRLSCVTPGPLWRAAARLSRATRSASSRCWPRSVSANKKSPLPHQLSSPAVAGRQCRITPIESQGFARRGRTRAAAAPAESAGAASC